MKVLLLTDRKGWSYDSIAISIKKYNTDKDISFDIECIKNNSDKIRNIYKKYDRLFVLGWQTWDKVSKFLNSKDVLIGVHSHRSFDEGKTIPEHDIDPPKNLLKHLGKFLRVNVISERLKNLFEKNSFHVYYTPNGIDTSVFVPGRIGKPEFTIGYSGSHSHDELKGISKYIIPAANRSGIKFKAAMLNTETYLPYSKMPDFYKHIDAYVCASSSEGSSLSVLEAASCGKPVISTRVGECSKIIENGINGYLVDRDIDAISDKINILRDNSDLLYTLSKNIRKKVVEEYSWDRVISYWIKFVKGE